MAFLGGVLGITRDGEWIRPRLGHAVVELLSADCPDRERPADERAGDERRGDERRGDESRGDESRGDECRGDECRGDECPHLPVSAD